MSRVQRSPTRPTGLMVKELRSPADVRVHYYRQGSAVTRARRHRRDPAGALRPRDGDHARARRRSRGRGARAAGGGRERSGASVSFDPNIRLKLWSLDDAVAAVRAVLPHVDDLLLSEAEALAIAGAGEPRRRPATGSPSAGSRGSSCGAAPTAPSGSPAASASRSRRRRAGPVVDCVGAGDAFTAGYLFERLAARPSRRRWRPARGRRATSSRTSATTRACPTAPTTTPGAAWRRRSTDERRSRRASARLLADRRVIVVVRHDDDGAAEAIAPAGRRGRPARGRDHDDASRGAAALIATLRASLDGRRPRRRRDGAVGARSSTPSSRRAPSSSWRRASIARCFARCAAARACRSFRAR